MLLGLFPFPFDAIFSFILLFSMMGSVIAIVVESAERQEERSDD